MFTEKLEETNVTRTNIGQTKTNRTKTNVGQDIHRTL